MCYRCVLFANILCLFLGGMTFRYPAHTYGSLWPWEMWLAFIVECMTLPYAIALGIRDIIIARTIIISLVFMVLAITPIYLASLLYAWAYSVRNLNFGAG